jgi:3-oxoacyl-(acyl-carrier-protein) synthase
MDVPAARASRDTNVSPPRSPERVVVTGLGVVAPNANGKDAFSRALRDGKSGLRVVPQLRELDICCQVGGFPQGIDELKPQYLNEEEVRGTNQNMTFASIAAIDAWEDAGLLRPEPGSDEVDWDSGTIVGTFGAGIDAVAEKLLPLVKSGRLRRISSTLLEQTMISGNSARVASLLALGNQASTACTTGNDAVVEAFRHIREGHAKRMLAGGSEAYSKYILAVAHGNRMLGRADNDMPEKASRPMSASASGIVPAAGAGILLLESLSSARARGARIYAEVIGGHVNSGGHRGGATMSKPSAEGLRRCIQGAVAMAGIRPEEIDAINGNLGSTPSDAQEVECWRDALGLPPSKMPLIHATKSLIGHALGAAGGLECVASVVELAEGFVHGSANCEDLHPALAAYADRIPHKTVLLPDIKVVAKTTFGFGDVNACVIFRKFES